MKPKYRIDNDDYEVSPISRGDSKILDVNGAAVVIVDGQRDANKQTFIINGQSRELHVARDGDNIFVQLDGEHWHIQSINPIEAAGGSSASSDVIVAPMPGTVVSVNVTVREQVFSGQTLLTIESMKLQTAIIAERDGQVAEVYFPPGDTFDKGADLLRFEPQAEKIS